MAPEPNTPGIYPAQSQNTDTVLWLNADAAEFMRDHLTRKQMGMTMRLACHIACDGPARLSSVRAILGLDRGQHSLPLRAMSKLFVVTDGTVDLNDYAFTPEQGGAA